MEHSHKPHEILFKNLQINKSKDNNKIQEHKTHTHVFRPLERKRLLISIILTFLMMIVEIIGGIFSGSLALLSDAGHMFTHSFALAVSYLAIVFASRPASKEQSFGFYRAEIIAALLNGLTLILIGGFIIWEAYKRILSPKPINEIEMLITAIAGLVINILTAAILWKASKESLNVKSAFMHMLGDAGSSVGVVIGAVIIHFTGYYLVDPIFSIIIAVVILIWAFSLIKDSFRILMEFTPRDINIELLKEEMILQNEKIKDVHDLHVWEITSGMYCLTAHLIIDDVFISNTEEILKDISDFLKEKYNIIHPIIQFESGTGFKHNYNCNLNGFKSNGINK